MACTVQSGPLTSSDNLATSPARPQADRRPISSTGGTPRPRAPWKQRIASLLLPALTRLFAAIALGLVITFGVYLWGVSAAQDPPPLPVRFDAGSDHDSLDHSGRLFLPDQEWTEETQAGFIGGHSVYDGPEHPAHGTLDEFLHRNQRHNWEEYRFSSIPNDSYLVTLSFSEIGFPSHMVFDVTMEDRTVLDDFRVSAEVGGNYALRRRFAVTVADGELNVKVTPISGEPRLAAIEVEARPPDNIAPAIPTTLTTMSSYGAVLLDWANNVEDDLDGYHVYRAVSPDGPHSRLTVDPVHISHYQAVVTATQITNSYCVSAVDVFGNESTLTPCYDGVALDKEDATLPFYELEVPRENLIYLRDYTFSNDEVTGTLAYEGKTYPVEVRYRGSYGRFQYKKAWKIKFPADSPFPGQREINLRADSADVSLMRSKLGAEIFRALGVQLPQAEHVLLTLNGEYVGVYTFVEHVDAAFLERTGRNPQASIYKAVRTGTWDYSKLQPSEEAYRRAFEKKTNRDIDHADIIDLIEFINYSPDDRFTSELVRIFDVAAYLDYYVGIVLASNPDFIPHNVYLIHDLATDRWDLVPYDLDRTFESGWAETGVLFNSPVDMGTSTSPVPTYEADSNLLTRVLAVPQFRAYYCHRLAEALDTAFSESGMHVLIDASFAAIEQDGLRDWHKYGRGNNEWFIAAPDEFRGYVTERREFLLDQIPAYCSPDQPYLAVNEIMVDNQSILENPDEPGDFPAWFEIHNKGLEAVDLSGLHLTNDLSDPTKFQITNEITIPAGGFVTFYTDGCPEQGPRHTNFRLDQGGGEIGIFSGTQQVDAHTFGPSTVDVSEGRYPDSADHWRPSNVPTPGDTNALHQPIISGATHTPLLPIVSEGVTVTTTISDDGKVLTATLHYSSKATSPVGVPMTELQEDVYTAQIPPLPGGSLVRYSISAVDNDDRISTRSYDDTQRPYEYIVGHEAPPVVINEFMADNERVLGDPGELYEFPDWIELHNAGPDPVDLGGRYLTDDLDNPTKFRIADGVSIPAGGFLLFYADNDTDQGPRHANFRLNRNGGSVGLFDIDAAGNQPLDTYTYGSQIANVSEGRYPDGGDTWIFLTGPTPRSAGTPVIVDVRQDPLPVAATDTVVISATVSSDGNAVTGTLWYSTASELVAVPMTLAGSEVHTAGIPPQPDGAWVAYYVHVEASHHVSVTHPVWAPVDTHGYLVGYRPPPLVINEVMAANATTLTDPDDPGQFPDWIELHNAGSDPLDLNGMYLTDDLAGPAKFQITRPLTIPAGGFIVFYADNDPSEGPLHANFRLNRNGESIGLIDTDANGNYLIDSYTFGPQMDDVSERRYPSGEDLWIAFHTPSPGRAEIPGLCLPLVLKKTMD